MGVKATWTIALVAALAACGGGGGGGAGGGGGGGATPCTLQSDCPLRNECASGTCLALGTSTNPLQVASRTSNSGPRWVGDSLSITFNEKIRLGTNGIVLLDPAYNPVSAQLALSPDEMTVTITSLAIVAPTTVSVTFGSGLTDNWGHTCSSSSFGWDFPFWITGYPGSPASWLYGLTSAVDGTGAPYVGWVSASGSCGGDLHVYRSDMTSWSDDSGRLPMEGTKNAAASSLAARGDVVAVSWVETGCSPNTVRVAARTGAGSWSLVGDSAYVGSIVAATSLALDANERPIVAWGQANGEIHAARYNGTSWNALGGAIGAGQNVQPSLALAPGDVPCVSFMQWSAADSGYVVQAYCWDGGSSSWQPLHGGTPMPTADSSLTTTTRALAFDAGGAPVVGWARGGNVEAATFGGASWTTAIVATKNVNALSAPELAMDPTLGVVAGWGGSRDVRAASYEAESWHLMPTIVDVDSMVFVYGTATFAAGPTGPWGAWVLDGTGKNVRSVRANR